MSGAQEGHVLVVLRGGALADVHALRRVLGDVGLGLQTLQSRSEEGPVYAIGAGGAVQLNFDECSM